MSTSNPKRKSTKLARHIALVGYRGTGKTTLARLLAERLGVTARDSDPLVEARAGKSIAAIFAEDGEPAFRDLEETVLAELLDGEPAVLSPGGGAVLRESTRRRLRDRSIVIALSASPETLFRRLHGDPTTRQRRPGLTDLDPLEEIRTLLEARAPLYRETAHHLLDTENRTPEELVEAILDLISSPLPSLETSGACIS